MTKDTFYLHIKNAKDLKLISSISRKQKRKRKRRRENYPSQQQQFVQAPQQQYFNPFPSNAFMHTTNLHTENLRLQNREIQLRTEQIKIKNENEVEIKKEKEFEPSTFQKSTSLFETPMKVRFADKPDEYFDRKDSVDVPVSVGSDGEDFGVSSNFEENGIYNSPFTTPRRDDDSETAVKPPKKKREPKEYYEAKKLEIKKMLEDAGVPKERYENMTKLVDLIRLREKIFPLQKR